MPKKSKTKISLANEITKALERLLKSLAESSRFSFFKSIPLTKFLGEHAPEFPSLKDFTIGELVEMGEAQVSALHALKPRQTRHLIETFKNLLRGEQKEPVMDDD